MTSFNTRLAKFAFAAAALCGAGASQAGVIIASTSAQGFVTTSNFGRGASLSVAPWKVTDNGIDLFAFCIEPDVSMITGTSTYAASAYTGFETRDTVQRLYSLYYPTLVNDGVLVKASAVSFQLALWELNNDNGSLADGKLAIKASSNGPASKTMLTLADAMLMSAQDSSIGIVNHYNFTRYSAAGSQTIVSASVKLADVPEPASLAIFGLGALLMGGVARRRFPG
jgi:hypothetical protein